MRWLKLTIPVFVLAGLSVGAQAKKSVPVGLVMGAGATITRDKQTAPVKPGELIFAGDRLQAGSASVPFLFCPQKISASVAAKGEAVFEEKEISGAIESRKSVSACFLPAVQKLSVGSQQHFGVMMTRSASISAPKTTFQDRVTALSPEKRAELESELASIPSNDPAMAAVRGASLEKAGLLYDALEAYRAFAARFDEAAWVKRKIIEIENLVLKEQSR